MALTDPFERDFPKGQDPKFGRPDPLAGTGLSSSKASARPEPAEGADELSVPDLGAPDSWTRDATARGDGGSTRRGDDAGRYEEPAASFGGPACSFDPEPVELDEIVSRPAHLDSLPGDTAGQPGVDAEPEYTDYCPGAAGEPFATRAGERSPFMALRRTRLARRVQAESEAEIGQLWGQVFFGVEHLPPRTVIVTGARRGDGSTHIATSLALVGATANRELRIALVDFNLRHPAVAGLLGLRPEPGLTDVLEGRATLEATVQAVVLEGGNELHVLTAGGPAAQPLGLLKSRQTQGLIGRMAELYDHVILDVSTANNYPDPQVLGAYVDGAVLVTKASETPRETVAAAKKRLDVAGVRCLGVVLNQRTEPIPDFLYEKL